MNPGAEVGQGESLVPTSDSRGSGRQYLTAIQDTIAGAEAARVVMAKAVKRLERSELSEEMAEDAA